MEGTIGNITFFRSKDGFKAKAKSEVSADKINNDNAFIRTRENMAEFVRAAKAGKLIRNAFRLIQETASDSKMVGRLTAEMLRVVQLDATNTRGQRNVIDGEASLLEGFEFNIQAKLGTTLFVPYTATLDRVTGNTSISVPAFVPMNLVSAPSGSTHFQLLMSAAEIDFENEVYNRVNALSVYLPWSAAPTAVINLTASVPAASTHSLFMAFGIEFFQEVNGQKYPLKNDAFNACSLVKVDTP